MKIEELENILVKIDNDHKMTKVEEDTFAAIVLLTEKKVGLKRIARKHKLADRYHIITSIIRKEFSHCDLEDIKWILFKHGYMKKSFIHRVVVWPSIISWVLFLVYSYMWLEIKVLIIFILFLSIFVWGIALVCISDRLGLD
jgi:hypothetical protein